MLLSAVALRLECDRDWRIPCHLNTMGHFSPEMMSKEESERAEARLCALSRCEPRLVAGSRGPVSWGCWSSRGWCGEGVTPELKGAGPVLSHVTTRLGDFSTCFSTSSEHLLYPSTVPKTVPGM